MKKYNSFLGAFFSGDNGQGGYNAAYGKSALAKLYTSQDPAEQQMAAEGLARVDPESAGKWQQEQAALRQEGLKRKATMIANAPLEQRGQLYSAVLPDIRKDWAEAPDQYTPELDQMVTAWAQSVGGAQGKDQTPPAKVQEAQWFAKERGLKPGTPEYTKFIAGYSGAGGGPGIKIHPQTGVMYQESPNGISVYDWGTKSWNMIDAPEQPDEEVKFADMPPEEQEAVTRVGNGLNSHVGIVGGKVVPMDGRTPAPVRQTATTVPQAPSPPPSAGGQSVNPFAKPKDVAPATWNAPVVETRGGKQVRVRYGTYNGQPIEQVMGEAELTPEAPKPPTADERSARGYLDRMTAAEGELDKLVAEGFTPNVKDFYTAGEGAALNWMATPKGQVWRQQQEDWVRAKLRRESGAAIPPDEMDREIKTYFPQPGDSKDVIAAKKKSREMARKQFVTMAGSAAPSAPNKPAGGAKYKVGQIIQHNGKRYQVIGGDMNDPDLKEIP